MTTSSTLARRSFLRTLAAGAAGAALLRPFEAIAESSVSESLGFRFRGDSNEAVRRLRERYLLADDVGYFNHASIGTVPRVVHEARVRYLSLCEENPWLYMWGGAWEEAREDARASVGRLLGASPARIALNHNTTEGFSLFAGGLPLGPGDEVLFSDLNHDGASVAFEHQGARRGYSVRRAPFPLERADEMDADTIVAATLEPIRPETRALVLPHVDNMVGIRVPLARIVREAKGRGVEWVLVDGAQTAGMVPLDLDASGVDGYAGSPHKWLQAPKGLGFLYLSDAVQEVLEPMWMTWGQVRWAETVRRFEDYGTRNLAEAITLTDAVDFQRALDSEQKEIRLRTIHATLRERVEASPRLRWRSPRDWADGASLVGIEVEGADAPALGRWLFDAHGIVLRSFGGERLNTLRVSPHVITTDEEIDRLLALLEGYRG